MNVDYKKKFPKILKDLTPEEKIICDDFVKTWLQDLSSKWIYGLFESFNHNYSSKSKILKKWRGRKVNTLELGSGIGNHILYENLENQNYYVTELRSNMIEELQKRFPTVNAIQCDIQKTMPFENYFFDRVNAIHVLEHLPELPSCIDEVYRLLKNNGIFQVVLPCDPGLFYEFCRNISARRMFEKKYKRNYDFFIKREHINTYEEVTGLLAEKFEKIDQQLFPFKIPIKNINLCLGVTYKKKILDTKNPRNFRSEGSNSV